MIVDRTCTEEDSRSSSAAGALQQAQATHGAAADPQARRRRKSWQLTLRQREDDIREDCPAELLRRLGNVYWGTYFDLEGNTPIERLRWLLEDDALVKLACDALSETPQRKDLPDIAEIAGAETGNVHAFARPFLAALDIISPQPGPLPLPEDGVRLALAFWFNALIDAPIEWPPWYVSLLRDRPNLVADATVEYHRRAFRSGGDPPTALWKLADDAHADVSRLAIETLLERFPLRCRAQWLPLLRVLLRAGLAHASPDGLAALVERKLRRRSLTVAQRIHWLCCGLTLNIPTCGPSLANVLTGPRADGHIDEVVMLIDDGIVQVPRLSVDEAKLLIGAIAAIHPPMRRWREASGTAALRGCDAVQTLIGHLASQPGEDAADALAKLASNARLNRWEWHLARAAARQQETRREAEFAARRPKG